MKIHVIGRGLRAVAECEGLCIRMGCELSPLNGCDVAVAPYLTERLDAELAVPAHGVLVFHPSLLPTRRGGDAIKWAYRHGDNITGVTWFWAAKKMDDGDICAQEAFPLNRLIAPAAHYSEKVIPAMLRTLETAVSEFKLGYFRRVAQVAGNATFDYKVKPGPDGQKKYLI